MDVPAKVGACPTLPCLCCVCAQEGCPTTRCGLGGRRVPPPPILTPKSSENKVLEGFGTVGALYGGKIMKKWGMTSRLMGSSREC